jgi:hypothetical protein
MQPTPSTIPEPPRPPQPGQLSDGWRLVFLAGWVGVVAALGSVWYACRIAGIAPWWLGPETHQKTFFVILLPFLPAIVSIVAASVASRATCYVGIVAGVLTGLIAFGDLHFPGIAVVEGIIGVCAVMLSVACLGGRLRVNPDYVEREQATAA